MPRALGIRARSRATRRRSADISRSRVSRPMLTRITSRGRRLVQPIAASTWLGFRLPDEQALPAETAMPAMSKRISCAAADTPGMR